MTVTTIHVGTVQDILGIESIHDTIQQMTDHTTDWIDTDQAEVDYASNFEAYMPIGWEIIDDNIYRWDDAEEFHYHHVAIEIANMLDAFDIADYAIDTPDLSYSPHAI